MGSRQRARSELGAASFDKDPMEVLVRTLRARRPNGGELLVDEYWEFVDLSPRQSGTDYVPGMKRFLLRTGEPVSVLDEGVFQNGRNGEVLLVLGQVSR